jgi:hypothetical protein
MADNFLVVLKFRTGQEMTIHAEHVSIHKGKRSPYNQLHIDEKPVATLEKGSTNYDANNNFRIYNASPLPLLYDYMPSDWDKQASSLKIIDEIFVRTSKG